MAATAHCVGCRVKQRVEGCKLCGRWVCKRCARVKARLICPQCREALEAA